VLFGSLTSKLDEVLFGVVMPHYPTVRARLLEMSVYYSSRPASADFYRVQTATQAVILDDRVLARLFYPFLGQEKTVSQAAAEVGCKLNAMHYRVKTFLEAGLLMVVREEKRAGRPVKIYRSVANAFFVPFQLTAHATAQESWLAHITPVAQRLARSMAERHLARERAGQCIFRDDRGNFVSLGGRELPKSSEIVFHPDASYRPLGSDRYGNIFLTEAEARRLEGELVELFARYLGLWHSDAQVRREHLFLYAFAPAPSGKA
jgi:hypothetical protein